MIFIYYKNRLMRFVMKHSPGIFLIAVLLFAFNFSFAQNVTIRGTVKDANGQPLPGASVQVQGKRMGALTDNAGTYQLSLPTGKYTLIVSYAGSVTQRVEVNAANGMQQDFAMTSAGFLEDIVVVGSRNVTRTRTETPVPVDVIPVSRVINEIGQVDLNQIMNYIAPSFQSARQTVADGTDHVDPAQLRGLGTDQVLVLINGKRRHQSALVNVNGTINRGQVGTDLGAIPATAVERIEILRDGAAAQYGSDAIAGVINIVLKKQVGLLEANAGFGFYNSEYAKNYALYKATNNPADPNVKVNDGETVQASVGYGFGIGKGVLHLTGEYVSRNRTNRTGTYNGAAYANVNGVNRDDSIMNARGITRDYFDMFIGQAQIRGGAAFYNFEYPLSSKTELYVFGGISRKKGSGAGFFRYPSSISSGAKIYAADVFETFPNGFLPQIVSELTDFSTAAGVRTQIGSWNLDVSNTFGINRFDFNVENSINYTQLAVTDNPQTSFDAGGLKFWQNTVNADISRRFDVLAGLNVAGGLEYRIDAFGIGAGEEASYKNYDVPSGATSGAQVFAGFTEDVAGNHTRNAKAVYIDLEQDFNNKFLLTGALRFENYSDFGSTLNYKFAGRYKVARWLNVRASLSTGFRAPSMQQRFYAKTNTIFVSTPGGLVPQESGTFTNESRAAEILGIPTLKEETSQNYSVGITATPFSNFELTMDAYQVNIDNRIVLTNNFTGGNNPQLQAELEAVGAGAANFFTNAVDTRARGLETLMSYTRNFSAKHSLRATLAMTFIDNEVKKGADGKPVIHSSEILKSSGQLGSYYNREDQSRIEVANPKYKASLTLNYKYSQFSAMLRFLRFGKVQYLDPSINPDNPNAFPVNAFTGEKETLDQTFSAKTVTDLSLSYQLMPALGLTIGANNLFDVVQDQHAHSGNWSLGRFVFSRRVQQMGSNGAFFFAKLRFSINMKE
jgi:iron complex outermembrane receptor protein